MMIFQSDSGKEEQPQYVRDENDRSNLFVLSEQQKLNINKRLPRGFCLIKKDEYDRLGYMKAPFVDNIVYQPVKIQRQVDLENPIAKSIDIAWNKKQDEARRSNRISLQTSIEGRSRQSQKIKNIIQRFRKLIKNSAVESYLNKVGLMQGLNEIQVENKKGLLTIDTFKARYMLILETAKSTTFEIEVINQIDDNIEEFMCYVEQARKTQFENNIQSIQKSIDKITRYLSDTADSKTQGNWYIRKRKKTDKNQIYTEKQILYIGQLVKKLPVAYLAGICQILYEKPFNEIDRKMDKINLTQVDAKKLRDIETYAKNKLSQLYRSRQRKKQKIQAKRQQKKKDMQSLNAPKQQANQQPGPDQKNYIEQIDKIFSQGYDEEMKPMQEASAQFGVKKQFDIPQLEYEPFNLNPVMKENKLKIQQEEINDEDLISLNSSDSSMITDEDDSDF